MVLEAKPSPPLSQALILLWGSTAVAVSRVSASPMLHLDVRELLSELWFHSPGLEGVQRCCCFRNELLFVSVDTVR